MKKEDRIRHWAFLWWNFNQTPPVEICAEVIRYIKDHPKEFKGATPQ